MDSREDTSTYEVLDLDFQCYYVLLSSFDTFSEERGNLDFSSIFLAVVYTVGHNMNKNNNNLVGKVSLNNY